MDREKQIAEMAKVIDKSPWKLYQDFTGCHINSSEIAEYLYNADCRKQSEVAREIFEEIKKQLRGLFDFFRQDECIRESSAIMLAISEIAELKKKYTEKDNGERT